MQENEATNQPTKSSWKREEEKRQCESVEKKEEEIIHNTILHWKGTETEDKWTDKSGELKRAVSWQGRINVTNTKTQLL